MKNERKLMTPIKSIREKCKDCSCYQPKEIRNCIIIDCPLYAYRMGRRPDKATLDTLKEFYAEKPEPC
jgi:hypothetical protein